MEIQFTLYSKEKKIICMSLRILLSKEKCKYFMLIFTIHTSKVNTLKQK